MTTEQKEAIEKLQQKLNPKEFGGYCVLGYNQKYCFGKSEVEAIETVLNLIQEQEKEIEKYKKLYQKALNNTIKSDRENIQLKKQIDLMTKWIEKHTKYYDEDGYYCELEKEICRKDIDCIDCIKQYFEKQAKEKGE